MEATPPSSTPMRSPFRFATTRSTRAGRARCSSTYRLPRRRSTNLQESLDQEGESFSPKPDHGSHVVACDCPEIFQRIKAHRRRQFRNPLIGRDLPRLASAAGFEVIDTWLTPVLYRSLSKAMSAGGPFGVAVEAAVTAGAISAKEAERYESSLAELDARGGFFFAGLAVSLSAVAPAP